MLLPSPSSMRAAATTPAEPADARVARFPAGGSLPRQKGGSASALLVSGPAQRSLALQPAWSLSRPRRPRYIGVLQAMSLPPSPAPIATGWSDSCRAGFAPARRRRLSTAHLRTRGRGRRQALNGTAVRLWCRSLFSTLSLQARISLRREIRRKLRNPQGHRCPSREYHPARRRRSGLPKKPRAQRSRWMKPRTTALRATACHAAIATGRPKVMSRPSVSIFVLNECVPCLATMARR